MIKFEHTIFALPFAFTGALLAARGSRGSARSSGSSLPWSARDLLPWDSTVGRTGTFDAANPRTRIRALPQGLVTPSQVMVFTAVSSAVLLFAAYKLNPLSFFLSPLALAVVFFYSYTKRFTFLSHAFLGLAISLAPIGAWIAVTGRIEGAALVLGAAVLFWLLGFDVLYALQDREFDVNAGLHSIPQQFGVRRSLWISRAAHAVTMAALFWLGLLCSLGIFYYMGVVIALCLIVYEHTLVKENDLSRLDMAFFNMNGYISVTIFIFTLLETLL